MRTIFSHTLFNRHDHKLVKRHDQDIQLGFLFVPALVLCRILSSSFFNRSSLNKLILIIEHHAR